MKKVSVIFIGLFLLCICSITRADDMKKLIMGYEAASSIEKQQLWSEITSYMNKSLPMSVDSETTIENIAPLRNGLTFRYRMDNYDRTDVPKEEWILIIQEVKENMKNRFCTDPESTLLKDLNALIKCKYYDKSGKYIDAFSFFANDCDKELF